MKSPREIIARRNARIRKRDVETPPLVKSKRNRRANQEDRYEDFGGRRSRLTKGR